MVLRVLRVSLSSVLAVHVSTAIESSWPRAANTSIAFFSLGCEMLWNSKYEYLRRSLTTSLKYYPVVIITCVHYLGPPGPSTFQILGTFSRFSEDFLGRERETPREDPLGTGRIPYPEDLKTRMAKVGSDTSISRFVLKYECDTYSSCTSKSKNLDLEVQVRYTYFIRTIYAFHTYGKDI